ncbi:PREDICTED: uncharacterized protein LOC108773280 [Cyphomyrmex costatus]|uniref:uncharacterized protein LOC108773280 n=1 Tax=Cyphomyrmex costatus TaxID=456900 RepID=UPI0008523190|nr:PREDICTED: uncharacterized protein LOC108773280 [Cyphomyrmex costatus]
MIDNAGGGSGATDEQVRSWKIKRAQIKAQCTMFGSYLEGVDLEQTSVSELRQGLNKVKETWGNFSSVQAAIEEIENAPEHVDNHNEERNIFEDRYFSIAAGLETLIERKLTAQSPNLAQVTRGSRGGTPFAQESSVATEHLKLPRVNLPTFSGAFDEWIPFRNMFQSMIDSNIALPEVQKMQYLISVLKGEARDVIGSLEVSDENYVEAWEMLKERYDDSGWIIQKHIKALFEISVIPKENHLLIRRLLDDVLKHLRALKALKRPTEHWDDLIVYLVTSRLDQKTSRAWEVTVKKGEVPTLKQLTDFLAQHSKALEASSRMIRPTVSASHDKGGSSKAAAVNLAIDNNKCAFCLKEGHVIYKCYEYLKLEVNERVKEARSRKLCLNCLRDTSHLAKQCTLGPCRKCKKRHNTLLHWEQTPSKNSVAVPNESSTNAQEKVVATIVSDANATRINKQVLLATAIVKVMDIKGNAVLCRALLDSGSQSCFVTNDCARRLALRQYSTNIPICGLGGMSTETRKAARISISSRINNFQVNLNFLVVKNITQALPTNSIQMNEVQIPKGIELAEFHKASKVDMLLGAEIFLELLCIGRIKLAPAQPTWQKTLFGWVVSGNLLIPDGKQNGTTCNLVTNEQLNLNLKRFWQLESNERKDTRSPEERVCEEQFIKTYRRNDEGRFIVSLPTKDERLRKLGDSRDIAIRRFKNLERRFEKQSSLK